MKRRPALLFLLAIVALFLITPLLKYAASRSLDVRSRPWAYSNDSDTKLLVGKWHGTVTDPDGVQKTVTLEIDPPVSEEERKDRANDYRRTKRKMSRTDKQAFDGIATIESRLGREEYELYGHVGKDDYHQLEFHFTPVDEAKRILPNQTAREVTEGRWDGDEMTAMLHFTAQDAEGHSQTSSEGVVVDGKLVWNDDPKDRPLAITLKRVP
jgi:hypothetical protein